MSEPGAPLEYRDREADQPDRERQQLRTVGAAAIGLLTVFGCGVVWVMWNLQLGGPPTTPPPLEWKFPTLCSAGALALLLALGTAAWRRGDRTIPRGLLIGTSLGLLCEGICFAAAN
jgi:hypothetical protein